MISKKPTGRNPETTPHLWHLSHWKRKGPLVMEDFAHGGIWQRTLSIVMVVMYQHEEVHSELWRGACFCLPVLSGATCSLGNLVISLGIWRTSCSSKARLQCHLGETFLNLQAELGVSILYGLRPCTVLECKQSVKTEWTAHPIWLWVVQDPYLCFMYLSSPLDPVPGML